MPRSHLTLPPEHLVEGFYTSALDTVEDRPVRTFLPTGYEPNYPYPLLVFFHGDGGSEEQVLRLAPNLSRRNYVSISLRGTQLVDSDAEGQAGYSWGPDAPCDFETEEYVLRAIEQTRRHYHIHSERIFLAGLCEGATLAYRLGLMYPEKFGGVIALNGTMPRKDSPLFRLPELRQLRVLIGHGIANPVVPLGMARRDYRLLYTAGLTVRLQTYPTTHRLHADMLRDVDKWIQRVIEMES
jgi:phospholipase/carboxylesterase